MGGELNIAFLRSILSHRATCEGEYEGRCSVYVLQTYISLSNVLESDLIISSVIEENSSDRFWCARISQDTVLPVTWDMEIPDHSHR
jgi:hypothetical protein